jgi:YhcH/YjgK/YiaL family protein
MRLKRGLKKIVKHPLPGNGHHREDWPEPPPLALYRNFKGLDSSPVYAYAIEGIAYAITLFRGVFMFQTAIQFAEKYDYLNERLKAGYEFLHRKDLASLPVGVISLSKDITVQVQEYTTIPPETVLFETHDAMFDIQYVVSGQELFGVASRRDLTVKTPYDAERDVTFYEEPPLSGWVLLKAGDFIVVSPEDGHKPRCSAGGAGPVKKLVIKVRV